MALITTAEAKGYLGITTSTYDSVFDALIPIVSYATVYRFCNNRFLNPRVYLSASTFTFDAANDKVTDSESQFLASYFLVGAQDIIVRGSYFNDGIYETSSVSANELVINKATMTKPFVDENSDAFITIQKVEFPVPLKETVAKYLYYLAHKDNIKGVKSESVLSYSVSYSDIPTDIKTEFLSYRKVKW